MISTQQRAQHQANKTMNDIQRLWEPVSLGGIKLRNRLAMAPMTRDRSTPSGTPTDLNARYYEQRASFGLIISEGTDYPTLGDATA